MKFLIISEEGSGTGIARRLKDEGHDARIWIRQAPEMRHCCEGIIDFSKEYTFGQTVIADCTGAGPLLDLYRQQEILTVGGSSWADKLEMDRKYSEEVFREVGIEVPKSIRLTSWEDAAKAIEELGSDSAGKVALKPEGDLSGVVPSYVSHDGEDALRMLEHMKQAAGDSKVELIIEEFIEGTAVSTEGWFNGEEWIEGMFNHTIERKQFLDDDLGPSGGCTGNLVWACDSKDPLVTELLTPLTEVLRSHVYRGALDVNAIVTKKGVYALEFTPRFGYDALPTLMHALCRFNFGNFLDDLARGRATDYRLEGDFAAGVRLSLPPWPSQKYQAEEGVPLNGFDEDAWGYFFPCEVKEVGDELVSSGGSGVLGVMNYEGASIGQAFTCVYYQIGKLRIPNVQYRTDLGRQCLKDFRELGKVNGEYEDGWIGVDFDKTLATHQTGSGKIGEPIPEMVSKVKRWIREGKEVRIFTARGTVGSPFDRNEELMKLYEWIEDHLDEPIEITDRKDPEMIRLYDDRVVKIEANEGVLA